MSRYTTMHLATVWRKNPLKRKKAPADLGSGWSSCLHRLTGVGRKRNGKLQPQQEEEKMWTCMWMWHTQQMHRMWWRGSIPAAWAHRSVTAARVKPGLKQFWRLILKEDNVSVSWIHLGSWVYWRGVLRSFLKHKPACSLRAECSNNMII